MRCCSSNAVVVVLLGRHHDPSTGNNGRPRTPAYGWTPFISKQGTSTSGGGLTVPVIYVERSGRVDGNSLETVKQRKCGLRARKRWGNTPLSPQSGMGGAFDDFSAGCRLYIVQKKILSSHRPSDIRGDRRSMTGCHRVRYSKPKRPNGRFPRYTTPRPFGRTLAGVSDSVKAGASSNPGPFRKIPNTSRRHSLDLWMEMRWKSNHIE